VGRPTPPTPCEPTLGAQLAAAGVGGVMLQVAALPPGPPAEQAAARVRAQLGAPAATGEGWMAWGLPLKAPCAR